MVGKSVDSSSPPVDHSVSEEHHSHVLLISSDSPESGNDSPIPAAPESPASVPLEQGGNHTVPPPSSSVVSFDWSRLTKYRLPSHVPFWVTVHAYNKAIPGTVLDEGASVILMPATTWQALGSPLLVPVASNLTAFDGGTSQLLGILPKFPITLGGKTVYIDVSVTQGALYFSLLLGRDYVYAMGALVSSLFRVVFFPHDGRIVTIDQLSFVRPWVPPVQSSSPPGFHPQLHLPQHRSTTWPPIPCLHLVMPPLCIVSWGHWALTSKMFAFPAGRHSWKPRLPVHYDEVRVEHSSFPVSSSLKNETGLLEHSSF